MGPKETFSMLEKVKILKSAAIFSKIPDEVLAEVAPLLEGTVMAPGKTVFRKGELGTSMYIIAEGLLRVHDGDKTLVELGEGNIFGEFSALDPEPRTASVTAINRSLLFEISQEELHTLIENHIEVAKGIIQILCQRLRDLLSKKSHEKNPPKPTLPIRKTVTTTSDEESLSFQHEDELALIEKVIILKTVSIFADTPDNVLSDIAAMTEETFLHKNETLFRKGDVGTAMYIVVSGRVQVHDGPRVIAELGERALIGEMAVLSSEPRTASVTAMTDTLLLSLTQTSSFELMWDQNKIVRGIIRVLIQRLRGL
jgi:CRP-like cAMP-binding protein